MNRNLPYRLVIVLGLLVCLTIFLSPMYGSLGHIPYLQGNEENKTYAVFEQSLCLENIKPRGVKTLRDCPRGGIVTVQQGGRLGNQIWEYASVWAVARRTGLEPYVPGCIRNTIDELFDNLSIPTFEDISHCPLGARALVLPIYSRLFEEAVPYLGDLPREFRLRRDVVERCQEILRAAARLSPRSTRTFVGVHVRRADYPDYLRRKYQDLEIATADAGYFRRAMEVFERKYDDVVFVVLSDDLAWCRMAFFGKSNVYISWRRRSAVVDLALMASCNHSIYDYGTYGDWGALLAGGDTVYFNLSVNPSAQMGKMIPNWSTIP